MEGWPGLAFFCLRKSPFLSRSLLASGQIGEVCGKGLSECEMWKYGSVTNSHLLSAFKTVWRQQKGPKGEGGAALRGEQGEFMYGVLLLSPDHPSLIPGPPAAPPNFTPPPPFVRNSFLAG